MIDPIPSIKEELERKTLDVLESLIHRMNVGRIERADAAVAARTIWDLTSGLVHNHTSAIAAHVARVAGPREVKRILMNHKTGAVVIVKFHPDQADYVVEMVTPNNEGGLMTHRHLTAEVDERPEKIRDLLGVLSKSGYLEI